MTTAEILNAAADLIEPEGRWTQGAFARNAIGEGLSEATLPAACQWCAGGAIARVMGGDGSDWWLILKGFGRTLGDQYIVSTWNDAPGRTQAEVVQALRDAAKAAS